MGVWEVNMEMSRKNNVVPSSRRGVRRMGWWRNTSGHAPLDKFVEHCFSLPPLTPPSRKRGLRWLLFYVFSRRRVDFAEMMGVRGKVGELGLPPAPPKGEGRLFPFSHHHSIIWNLPSLSPFGESRSGALKARSAHRFDWCFFGFFQYIG